MIKAHLFIQTVALPWQVVTLFHKRISMVRQQLVYLRPRGPGTKPTSKTAKQMPSAADSDCDWYCPSPTTLGTPYRFISFPLKTCLLAACICCTTTARAKATRAPLRSSKRAQTPDGRTDATLTPVNKFELFASPLLFFCCYC